MKIIVAPDSFKGSISSSQAANAISRAILEVAPESQVLELPMADGGEGTVDAVFWSRGGEKIKCLAEDPLGREIIAEYGWIKEEKMAIIETAAASGLPLLGSEELNPEQASSFGTGQLIRDALSRGAEKIILGLGGSATVDAGVGLFQALGLKVYGAYGEELQRVGGRLDLISSIDISLLDPGLKTTEIIIASDVTNPLLGKEGAIAVFGPQKGITTEEIAAFEQGMAQFSEIVKLETGLNKVNRPGSGAAGGIGFLFHSFLDVEFRSGIELMLELTGLNEELTGADFVFTGEGKIDGQSLFGKVPVGIGRAAGQRGIPVIAFAGTVGEGIERLEEEGVSAVMPIADKPMPLDEAMERGEDLLYEAAKRVMQILKLGKGFEKNTCDE